MNELWAVGLDGGGTKTSALGRPIKAGQPLRRSEAGPCNIAAMDPAEAAANVGDAVAGLAITPDHVGILCLGVAGFSAVHRRHEFGADLRRRYPNAEIEIVPDYIVAHAGAFDSAAGVIVVAGTGSVAYGVNPIGESAVVGGYGYLVDDSGTGYGLGRLVIAAAGRVFDGAEKARILSRLFTETTGIKTREALIAAVYGGQLDRPAIAALAPLVSRAADEGDTFAASLLMHSGGALARLAQAAIGRLFTAREPVSIAKVGSLWSSSGELNGVFDRSLVRACSSAVVVRTSKSPVEGALSRALAAVSP